MATSPEAFRQVKNLLQKLDQSIDAARDRRLTSPARAGASNPAAPPAKDTYPNRARPLPPRPQHNDPNRGFITPNSSPSQH